MKFRGTYVLSGIVALLAAVSLYEFKSDRGGEESSHQVKLFEQKSDEIDQIQLIKGDRQVVLKKDADKWLIVEPLQDVAEDLAVRALLMQLTGERGRLVGGENMTKEKFGLDKPQLRIEVSSRSRKESLAVGSVIAFDGSYYLQVGDVVSMGEKDWSRIVEQDENTLRRREIFPEALAAKRISAHWVEGGAATQYMFEQAGGIWTIKPDPGFAIDSLKVDHWLDSIESLSANRFESENATEEQLKEWGLTRPQFHIKIEMAAGPTWEVSFSEEKNGEVFVQTNLRKTIYRVGALNLKNILAKPDFFRDGKVPFQFALEKATDAFVQIQNSLRHLKKGEVEWSLEPVASGEKLNAEKLVDFFHQLQALEAVDFPSSGTGFPAQAQLRIQGAEGKPLLELFVGATYKAPSGLSKGAELHFVRVAGQNQILGVKSSLIQELFNGDFLK